MSKSGMADVEYQAILMQPGERTGDEDMTGTVASSDEGLMTVGELARRTGLSIKAIRQYEALGLIYSPGRSEGGYRLFDDSALWCAQVISTLRSLGLTIKEIDRLGGAYLSRPDEPIGPHLAALLDGSEQRIADRIAELTAVRERIRAYRARHAAALAGRPGAGRFGQDPRRQRRAA
jgi:MerR family copper efflux transcriptional regulator